MYNRYIVENIKKIEECLSSMECQPILFIGSGFSKRHFSAPNWSELLEQLCKMCPEAKPFLYYKQTYENNIEVGSQLAMVYKEWAWGVGKEEFKEELFTEAYKSDIFIKSKISEFLDNITPERIEDIPHLNEEIKMIQYIRPHAIITTNYDRFLELIFPEYTPIIGQKILKSQYSCIGEIFKIHGCISEPESLVLTKTDYDNFRVKKKYLSAKLLTFFLEHPLVFIGYNAEDPNIQAILSDIDEIITTDNQLVPNIYIVDYQEEIVEDRSYQAEKLIALENDKSIRVNSIAANKYSWIYGAFTNENAIERVNPKLLRALLSRTYDLVRTDIPRKTIEIDYNLLESALEDDRDINKIYGITNVSDPSVFNITYPYTLTDVAKRLGYTYWSYANDLINKVKQAKGVCIKESDNRYHISIKTGGTSKTRKYSKECIELLKKVRDNEDYILELGAQDSIA